MTTQTSKPAKFYAETSNGTRVELIHQCRDWSIRAPRTEEEAEKAALREARQYGFRLTIFGPDGPIAATRGEDDNRTADTRTIEKIADELSASVAKQLANTRARANAMLAVCDRVAPVLARLTPALVRACLVRDAYVLIYHLSREQTLEFMRLAKAGDWRRSPNPSYPDKLDYTASIDGVQWQIYAAAPPASCRIVEEEIEIPARRETKRTIVCR